MMSGSWFKITAVVGILVVLLEVSWGAETYCDFRTDGAQCFGSLGGAVLLQLMNNISEIPKYECKHNTSKIMRGTFNNSQLIGLQNRHDFILSNGTLIITNLSRNDSGTYTVETFGSDGKSLERKTLQLNVEAPVSSVQLVSQCLSQGQINVSCLSEGGDSRPQYSWTLDGHSLRDSELFSGNNESNIIVLRQNISGRLVCSVRNQVSFILREIQISTCVFINCSVNGTEISTWMFQEYDSLCVEPTGNPSPDTPNRKVILEWWPVVAGALGALITIIAVSSAIIRVKKKKKNNRVEEDNVELTNDNGRRRREEQSVDVQAEYSQVTKKPRHSDVTLSDDVYAKVHKQTSTR
ncbi:hepatocyte cell adhesion molecule-like isoform X1 [Poecilia reticulata]|uniref:hepatocyte cell adhesion molecule-like isoform X1 n=1 Tax=Poecilia reticulata TaxID=8081 RepID=UPI0007EBE3F2|nr:PREDICTED: hepatocyte cell adhesion molecule-like isoform X1 [Poecilia reticulata]